MIITTEVFKIKKNNQRWKTGFINFKKFVSEKFNWEDTVVHVVLFTDEDFHLSDKQMFEKFKKVKQYMAKQEEIKQFIEELK
jgi:hypothetical protein